MRSTRTERSLGRLAKAALSLEVFLSVGAIAALLIWVAVEIAVIGYSNEPPSSRSTSSLEP